VNPEYSAPPYVQELRWLSGADYAGIVGLAVAAVGKLREFPADSSHVLNVIPELIGSEDLFSARFSGSSPQIAVGAPGIAIVSTVPGSGYLAADGTAAAAAHVTGFAVLVLAHHPLFQPDGLFAARTEERVQALSDLIQASAVAHFLDPKWPWHPNQPTPRFY
jgi:subtilisin